MLRYRSPNPMSDLDNYPNSEFHGGGYITSKESWTDFIVQFVLFVVIPLIIALV